MKTKIYIIGNIPSVIDLNCESKFYNAQLHLLEMGYDVFNPMERLMRSDLLYEEAKRKNLSDLMNSDGVYILPCTNLFNGYKNIEIKLALNLNLTIVLGTIDLSIEKESRKNTRNKRKKKSAN